DLSCRLRGVPPCRSVDNGDVFAVHLAGSIPEHLLHLRIGVNNPEVLRADEVDAFGDISGDLALEANRALRPLALGDVAENTVSVLAIRMLHILDDRLD